uniref:Uncharacterized protein n=1 Tax=Acrobeloides nanus TaxID=290746 RepID=A0A914CQX5_9BILA
MEFTVKTDGTKTIKIDFNKLLENTNTMNSKTREEEESQNQMKKDISRKRESSPFRRYRTYEGVYNRCENRQKSKRRRPGKNTRRKTRMKETLTHSSLKSKTPDFQKIYNRNGTRDPLRPSSDRYEKASVSKGSNIRTESNFKTSDFSRKKI